MIKAMATRLGNHRWRLLVLSFSILVIVGCGQDKVIELPATAVPVQSPTQAVVEPLPTSTPVPDAAPASTPSSPASTSPSQPPTPVPASKDTVADPAATPAPSSEANPLPPLADPVFELLSPANGTVSEVGVIRARGKAEPGAWAIVNGTPVAAGQDGTFQFDLPLDEGPNTIEVSVANAGGKTQTRTSVVSFVPSDLALPFSLFYPLDGVETRQPTIPVFGVTRPDAVVAINGDPVDVNASGIFSGQSDLEEGANLVEVVATDIDGNIRSGVIAVFYIP
jgi:hypothetical protein